MERRPGQRYPEEFKLEVLTYYYEHEENRKATLTKYKIDHSCLRDWLLKYGSHWRVVSLQKKRQIDMAKYYKKLPKNPEQAQQEYEQMQKDLEQAKKDLEMANLRADAWETMVNVAEEMFGINIKKKVGAKPSSR